MSTLLYKCYLAKVSTNVKGGVKNTPNFVYVVCTRPLVTDVLTQGPRSQVMILILGSKLTATLLQINKIDRFNQHNLYQTLAGFNVFIMYLVLHFND